MTPSVALTIVAVIGPIDRGDRIPFPQDHLTLRSIAERCVSKDGQQTRCSFPSFETRPFGTLLRMRSVLY
jgi:hypothetical protein